MATLSRFVPSAKAVLEASRPRQWTKNLFVFAGLVFTDNWALLHIVLVLFLAYCLMSSGVYLLNDSRDWRQDLVHPDKRRRPIPRGDLGVPAAASIGVLLCCGGMVVCAFLGLPSVLLAAVFLGLQAAYTFWLKSIVLLDVFAIAAAFVVRVVAGATVIQVPVSVWLLVCTLQLALFLGFGKRRHEITRMAERAGEHRETLDHYSIAFLDQLISIVLGALIVSYAVYSAASPTAVSHPGLVATLPFVIYGVFRYLYLIHIRHMGGSPELILLQDRPLQATLFLWILMVVAAFRL